MPGAARSSDAGAGTVAVHTRRTHSTPMGAARRAVERIVAQNPFRPRWPWVNGDLQTLRNTLMRPRVDLERWPETILTFLAASGRDYLSGRLQLPEDAFAKARRPLVMLLHGLTGSAQGHTMRQSALALLGAGYPVLRLNLRGAGETAPRCSTLYHTGLTADPRAVIAALPERLRANGVAVMGYSLGGNTALLLGCEADLPPDVRAIVSVCAPVDPAAAVSELERPRNRFYARFLLSAMKRDALACTLNQKFAQNVRDARSVRHYDDTVTAPMHGFEGASDFYRSVAAGPRLTAMQVPTLAIHAEDDPWVPMASYRQVEWHNAPLVKEVFAAGGGHCGFHDEPTVAGNDPAMPWHDRVIRAFLSEI